MRVSRHTQRWFALAAIGLSCSLLCVPAGLRAQDAAVPAATADAAAPPVPAQSTTATIVPTIADLTSRRQADAQDSELDEATRTQLDQQYAKALENLQLAEQAERQTSALAQELETAPPKVAELEQQLANPQPQAPAAAAPLTGVEALSSQLKAAQADAATRREQAEQIKAEIERRALLRPKLGEVRTQTEQQLEETRLSLTAPPPDAEHPRITAVRLLRLECKEHRLRRELALIDQQSRTFEAAAKYWSLQQDLADRAVLDADRLVQAWQHRTAEAQREQASVEALQARRALAQSHPSVRQEAEQNSTLADEFARIVKSHQETQQQLDGLTEELRTVSEEYESLRKRAEAADFSPAIGVLLRNRQAALPDIDELRRQTAARQAESSTLNLDLMEWEARRKPLIDRNEATAEVIDSLQSIPESITRSDLEEQVQSLLAARYKLLNDLEDAGSQQLELLARLDSQQTALLAVVDAEAQWLAEHVLWVPSAGLIGTQPRSLVTALTTIFDKRAWRLAGQQSLVDLSEHWASWSLGAIGLAALLVVRRRSKRSIRQLGEIAERSSCVEMAPTIKSLLLTLLVASPGPLAMLLIGARIGAVAQGNDLLHNLGAACQVTAICWSMIAFLRQLAHAHGLGDSHFGWPRGVLTELRRTTRLLALTLLPCVFVVAFTEESSDAESIAAVGRIAYLCGMIAFGWSMIRLFQPAGSMLQAIKSTDSGGLLYRSRVLWITLFLATPAILAGLSAYGYHYTAVQFTGRASATLGSAVAILLVSAFLHRWLLLTYRDLAIKRGRERRQLLLQAAQNDAEQPLPAEPAPELTLVDINAQSRRMLRLASGVCCVIALYLIWVDVLPALGFLRNFELYENSLAQRTDDAPIVWITAADYLVAFLIAGLTVLASRNLPGIMEIAVLQRLPMDAGARYAATTVSRYLIVVTGLVLGFRAIGVGWSSVQWLVAAMTVGLGFGLQEIFANFVSGIILLFERPMRVGDMVTIGGSSGTVTRIQIRATTILDWDYKELIVPNREFVTGNLVNWTLSSPVLRMVVKVGVAYGSDTRLVTELLMRCATENSQVLEDPPPFALLTQFGPSSLDFELRLYVSGLRNFGRVQHDLHTAIDDRFLEHGIEIAFPQRDLRLRSLPDDIIQQLARPTGGRKRSRDQDDHLGAA